MRCSISYCPLLGGGRIWTLYRSISSWGVSYFVKVSVTKSKVSKYWHQANCGGTYTKVKEPEGYGQKKSKKETKENGTKGQQDIRSLLGGNSSQGSSGKATQSGSSGKSSQNKSTSQSSGGGARSNIFGFGGTSFTSPASSGGGLKTKGMEIVVALWIWFTRFVLISLFLYGANWWWLMAKV